MPQLTKEAIEKAVSLGTAKPGDRCALCGDPVSGPVLRLTLGTGLSWPLPKELQGVLGLSCGVTVIGRMLEAMGATPATFGAMGKVPHESR